MRATELDYELPAALIAQQPVEPRDASRLLVYRRSTAAIEHRVFRDLVDLLDPSDVVVLNTTRVLPVRVRGTKPTGGAAEVLLLEPLGDGTWEALARPARRLAPGTVIGVGDGALAIEIVARLDGGRMIVRPHADTALEDVLGRVGEMPLPPYIHERSTDPGRYQTVYARDPGSAAAPTAGLHFTAGLLARLATRCTVLDVDLRVGLDTFRPLAVDDLDQHEMHSEAYAVAPDVRARLRDARRDGRRIIAVGTTVARVLETIADGAAPDAGRTRLKIQPGHAFGLVDVLVTNFHLPRSTLLALVMALVGVDETHRVYAEAIAQHYRFYSFGDAMIVLP